MKANQDTEYRNENIKWKWLKVWNQILNKKYKLKWK